MSVTSEPIIFKYTGDGASTDFAIQCHVLKEEDVHVFVNDVYVSPAIYTVADVGEEAGSTVVFDTAPTNGALIVIYRFLNYDRETDYQPNGPFLEQVVNADQDTQTMQIQQLVEELSRVIQLPIGTNLGYCTLSEYSEQTECLMNGGQWITGSNGTDGVAGGAFCSDPQWTTQASCEADGDTWNAGSTDLGYCTDPQWTTQATCQLNGDHWITNSGYCSLTQYTDKPACLAGGGTWTSQSGWCSNDAYTDQASCIANNYNWTISGAYCSIGDGAYTNEATCVANNGQWINGATNTWLPEAVANGIWKWNDTATEIEYILVEDLVQDVLDAIPSPSPQSLQYWGWSESYDWDSTYFSDVQNFYSTHSTGAQQLFIKITTNMTTTGGIVLQFLTGTELTAGTYGGLCLTTNGVTKAVTIQQADEAFGGITASTYMPVVKDIAGSIGITITVRNGYAVIQSYDLETTPAGDSNYHYGVVKAPHIGSDGIRLTAVNGTFRQAGTNHQFNVEEYAQNQELNIDAIVSSSSTPESLVAEYGNMGTYFVNTGSVNDLVFSYNGNRNEYPPVLDGQSIWFLATGNNAGNVTAQLGSQPALSVLDESGVELPADTFVENQQYRIYKRGASFRYAIPAVASVANKSITLAKIADTAEVPPPDYYLGFDSEGVAEWKAGSGGIFTDKYEDVTGINVTGASQSADWTHGLGAIPFGYIVEAECTDSAGDAGYPVGRRIKIDSYIALTAESGVTRGCAISSDDTKIYIKVGNGEIMVVAGSNGKYISLSPSKWKLFAKAWL